VRAIGLAGLFALHARWTKLGPTWAGKGVAAKYVGPAEVAFSGFLVLPDRTVDLSLTKVVLAATAV
jgi:hypothetical protein